MKKFILVLFVVVFLPVMMVHAQFGIGEAAIVFAIEQTFSVSFV